MGQGPRKALQVQGRRREPPSWLFQSFRSHREESKAKRGSGCSGLYPPLPQTKASAAGGLVVVGGLGGGGGPAITQATDGLSSRICLRLPCFLRGSLPPVTDRCGNEEGSLPLPMGRPEHSEGSPGFGASSGASLRNLLSLRHRRKEKRAGHVHVHSWGHILLLWDTNNFAEYHTNDTTLRSQ